MHLLENSNKEKIKKKQKRRLKRKIQSQEHDKSILKGIANCRILGINVFGHVNYPVGATYIYIYIYTSFSHTYGQIKYSIYLEALWCVAPIKWRKLAQGTFCPFCTLWVLPSHYSTIILYIKKVDQRI